MRFKHLFLIIVWCVLGVAGGIDVKAQKTAAFSVSPAVIEAKVKRGVTYSKTFTISNTTSVRLTVRCSAIDYWYDDSGKSIQGRPGTLPRSASNWIQFEPSEVTIEPGMTAKVNSLISVPLEAAGSFYTMPVFEAAPADKVAATVKPGDLVAKTSFGLRIRGLITLTTEDASEYSVQITKGKLVPPSVSSPLELDIEIRNRGTAQIVTRSVFALIDSAGKLAGRGKLVSKRHMPGQTCSSGGSWAGDLAPGRYTALVTVSYERAGMEPATLIYEIPFEVGAAPVAATKTIQ